MARLVTLATLQTRVLQRAAMQYGAATNSIAGASTGQPNGELVDVINEGIAALHQLICDVDGQPYYLESTTFNTVGNQDTYGIGPGQPISITDFYKPKGFDITFGQNWLTTARPFMWKERNRFKFLPGWVPGSMYMVYYRMMGKASGAASAALDAVKFIPQPPGAYPVTMWYLPTPTVLANATDQFDGIMGFEEFAVLHAARDLLMRQEQLEHAQMLQGLLAAEEQRILGAIASRDADEPERVTDIAMSDGWYARAGY